MVLAIPKSRGDFSGVTISFTVVAWIKLFAGESTIELLTGVALIELFWTLLMTSLLMGVGKALIYSDDSFCFSIILVMGEACFRNSILSSPKLLTAAEAIWKSESLSKSLAILGV